MIICDNEATEGGAIATVSDDVRLDVVSSSFIGILGERLTVARTCWQMAARSKNREQLIPGQCRRTVWRRAERAGRAAILSPSLAR